MTIVLTCFVEMSSETCNRQWWPNTCQHVFHVAPVVIPGIVFALVMHRGKGGDLSYCISSCWQLLLFIHTFFVLFPLSPKKVAG